MLNNLTTSSLLASYERGI